jgi:hypothetical protein
MQAQGHWMQIDNAKPHNSALSRQKTEELGLTRLAQRLSSLDLAHYDFFLFGYLKKNSMGRTSGPKTR